MPEKKSASLGENFSANFKPTPAPPAIISGIGFSAAQSLDEDKPRFIADLGDKEISDFALAPDGKAFAFTRGEWLHDAVLIDGLK